MGFGLTVGLEIMLILVAGLIIFGGVKGILAATILLSVINYVDGYPEQFWRRENFIVIGLGFGLLILSVLTRQARRGSKIQGLAAGVAGIVLLGAFVTPLVAIVIWVLIAGTGLIKKGRKSEVFWGFAPTAWRLMLAMAAILYGNVLSM